MPSTLHIYIRVQGVCVHLCAWYVTCDCGIVTKQLLAVSYVCVLYVLDSWMSGDREGRSFV